MNATLSLPDCWQDLVAVSRQQRMHAYAPYSQFAVGAAVKVSGGTIIGGCNVENSSYSLTICAERNAATSAVAAGNQDLEIVCISLAGVAVPCGACRQFLYEFNPHLKVIMDNVDDSSGRPPEIVWLGELLPRGFRLSDGDGPKSS
ncbi:MAG: cytidine deaminase [Fuerstiella sp.]